jgi:hypothetical protein
MLAGCSSERVLPGGAVEAAADGHDHRAGGGDANSDGGEAAALTRSFPIRLRAAPRCQRQHAAPPCFRRAAAGGWWHGMPAWQVLYQQMRRWLFPLTLPPAACVPQNELAKVERSAGSVRTSRGSMDVVHTAERGVRGSLDVVHSAERGVLRGSLDVGRAAGGHQPHRSSHLDPHSTPSQLPSPLASAHTSCCSLWRADAAVHTRTLCCRLHIWRQVDGG